MSASPDWRDLAVGDELPPLALEITATHIAAGAIATRDFMPVHHDRDYAQAQGAPDIFMNILSSTAHCSRWLTDWAGPDALVRTPGHPPRRPPHARGRPSPSPAPSPASPRTATRARVEIEFRAATDMGDHLTGTAAVTLPLD